MRDVWKLAVLGLAAACGDHICSEGAAPGIRLTVRASDGADLSVAAMVWAVRIAEPTVDSLESRLGVAGGGVRFTDVPGTYRLRVRHDGYVEQVETVDVDEDDDGCGAESRHITVTLQPLTTS